MLKKLLLGSVVAAALVCPAFSQQPPRGFAPGAGNACTQSISVSGTAASIQFNKCGPSVLLENVGSQEAFYLLSSNNTAATTSSFSIPGNSWQMLTIPDQGATQWYLSAITATSTTTLRALQGYAQ
jgi:hypothetical protein